MERSCGGRKGVAGAAEAALLLAHGGQVACCLSRAVVSCDWSDARGRRRAWATHACVAEWRLLGTRQKEQTHFCERSPAKPGGGSKSGLIELQEPIHALTLDALKTTRAQD